LPHKAHDYLSIDTLAEDIDMDEATHNKWWPLHYRVAKGETLSAEEQAQYEVGLQQLYAEEEAQLAPQRIERLREGRKRREELEAERSRLQSRYDALRAEIAALEARFSEPTRKLLGIEG
jgi:hypothetical protein